MFNNRRNNSLKIIYRNLKKINGEQRKKIINTSYLHLNLFEKWALWSYKNHLLTVLCLFTLISFIGYISYFVNTVLSIDLFIGKPVYRGICYTITAIYICIVAPLILIAESRFGINQHDRWGLVCDYYPGASSSETRREIKEELNSYQKQSRFLAQVILFIGALALSPLYSSKDLQNAVLNLSLNQMWNINPVTTITIGLLFPAVIYCFFRCWIPVNWLKNTLQVMNDKFLNE